MAIDKNPNESNISNKPPIPLIFLCTTIGIFITLIIIRYLAGVQYRDDEDIFNWVSLVVEIGIASGITIAVWRYTKFEQAKTNRLISNINQITTKLDKITRDQESFRTSRIKDSQESFYGNLISVITSAYFISQGQTMRKITTPDGKEVGQTNEFLWLGKMSEIISRKLLQESDILTPKLKATLQTVCNIIDQKDQNPAHATVIIDVAKSALENIDTALFSLDNIGGIEILEKV